MFLNKTSPAWAKGLLITIKDLCTVFIKSDNLRKHIRNLGYLDYLEILKLIPQDWQKKIKENTALPEQDTTIKVMAFSSKRKWQEKNIAERQCKDLYRTLHQRKKIIQCRWNKYENWQQQNYIHKLTQKQWEQLFLSLYKTLTFNINSYIFHNPP